MWPGDPLLSPFSRYEYGNNGIVNSLKFIHNTVASVVNTPINVINGLADETQYIYNNGIGSYLSAGTQNIGDAISSEVSYRVDTPISEQASDTLASDERPAELGKCNSYSGSAIKSDEENVLCFLNVVLL